jgi:succinate dehydrogenase / fumarate reductase iron-sulfur subunit
MKLKVFRLAPGADRPRYDTFPIEAGRGTTVLGALFQVQDRLDESLAFRYSCRGAVCGSCAMLVNRVPRLACRTQLAALPSDTPGLKPYPAIEGGEGWDRAQEVLVEPLPHLPVLRDLVVDMEPFFAFYRAVEPAFRGAGPEPERERRMNPEAVRLLEGYTNCILCGACYGACPVVGRKPGYLGPAALAKLYRFHIDPREVRDGARLRAADNPNGWWACEFYSHCRQVCPKGVPPNLAIGQARQELTRQRGEDAAGRKRLPW